MTLSAFILVLGLALVAVATVVALQRIRRNSLPMAFNAMRKDISPCSPNAIKTGEIVGYDANGDLAPATPAVPEDLTTTPPTPAADRVKPIGVAGDSNVCDGKVDEEYPVPVSIFGLAEHTTEPLYDPDSDPIVAGSPLYITVFDNDGVPCVGLTTSPADPATATLVGCAMGKPNVQNGTVELIYGIGTDLSTLIADLKITPKVIDSDDYDGEELITTLGTYGLTEQIQVNKTGGWIAANDNPLLLDCQCGKIVAVYVGGLRMAPGIDYNLV